MTPDRQELRRAFSLFATGVTVVTARNVDGEPVGVTANSLSSVSLDPPLLLWCLDNRSRNLSVFAPGAVFAVNILAEHQADIALRFARSGAAKFSDGATARGQNYPPTIDGALATISCIVTERHLAGDHTIIVGEVETINASNQPPLVFQASRFGRFVCDERPGMEEGWRTLIDMWS